MLSSFGLFSKTFSPLHVCPSLRCLYNETSFNYLARATMNTLWYLSTSASLLSLWHCFFLSLSLLLSTLILLSSSVRAQCEVRTSCPTVSVSKTPLLILKPCLSQTNTSSFQGRFCLLAVLLMKSLSVRLPHCRLWACSVFFTPFICSQMSSNLLYVCKCL